MRAYEDRLRIRVASNADRLARVQFHIDQLEQKKRFYVSQGERLKSDLAAEEKRGKLKKSP